MSALYVVAAADGTGERRLDRQPRPVLDCRARRERAAELRVRPARTAGSAGGMGRRRGSKQRRGGAAGEVRVQRQGSADRGGELAGAAVEQRGPGREVRHVRMVCARRRLGRRAPLSCLCLPPLGCYLPVLSAVFTPVPSAAVLTRCASAAAPGSWRNKLAPTEKRHKKRFRGVHSRT